LVDPGTILQMFLLPKRLLAASLACAAVLSTAACGGGGSTSPAPPPSDCFYNYNLTASPQLEGIDPLLGQQWHLRNTGQTGGVAGEDLRARDAWAQTRGEGIRVAVIDDAIETIHRDLSPNLASGGTWDYRTRDASAPLPCRIDDDHGTAVAGIVLARDDNATGGAGVAPRALLAAYNALATSTDADIADALNRDLAANSIYNNSWGAPDNGKLNRAEASYINAIRNGIDTGRGGKGAIYIFPAGNGGCYRVDRLGRCLYDDNSNYDGYVNQPGVIAVCAVDDTGSAPFYAEPGANVLVCAPSGGERSAITTTAPRDGYRNDFSGTSASTPMVAGTAALMLAANPALTWRDVRLILAATARKNDPGFTDPDLGWVAGTGGRKDFSPIYGFGTVDAQAAVEASLTWQSVGTSASLEKCGPYTRGPGAPFPIAIPDSPNTGSPLIREDPIAVSNCPINRIEFIQVGFSSNHPFSGDLRIELQSPNGLVSRLADSRLCYLNDTETAPAVNCGAYDDWRFGSVRHLDENTTGTWRLRVSDRIPRDTGNWTGWNITFWGRR
jgi:proprotein convertase subtilisin/kexin type 2